MAKGICAVDSCEKKAFGRGWCAMHYDRWRASGDPGEAASRKCKRTGTCTVSECGRPEIARGLCSTHYERQRKTGVLGAGIRAQEKRNGPCSVDGCVTPIYARRLCSLHHQRVWAKGDVGPAGRLKARPGEGHLNKDGYREITTPDGRRMDEHRYVMERLLGRELRPFENVHHRNGIRHQNDASNLELWTKPQPAGQRPEDLVAWVVEFYPDLVREALMKLA